MALKALGSVIKISDAKTRYISVPSVLTSDSAFKFKQNDRAVIEINPDTGDLLIHRMPDSSEFVCDDPESNPQYKKQLFTFEEMKAIENYLAIRFNVAGVCFRGEKVDGWEQKLYSDGKSVYVSCNRYPFDYELLRKVWVDNDFKRVKSGKIYAVFERFETVDVACVPCIQYVGEIHQVLKYDDGTKKNIATGAFLELNRYPGPNNTIDFSLQERIKEILEEEMEEAKYRE